MFLKELQAQATTTFFAAIERRSEALRAMEQLNAVCAVSEEIEYALNSCLDEESDHFTYLLLACCLEDKELFLRQPEVVSCIVQDERPEQVTAQHCVYHNVYAMLRNTIEYEFRCWLREPSEKVS